MPRPISRAAPLGSRASARRPSEQVLSQRSKLIEKIFNESSSFALNSGSVELSPRLAVEAHSNLLDHIQELRELEATCNPKLPCRNELSWKEFFNWIDEYAGPDGAHRIKLSSSLRVSNSSPVCGVDNRNEYSLLAKKPFRKDETIFAIHRRVMLSLDTIVNDPGLLDFVKNDPIAMTMPNVNLVLHLLNEYSKGRESFWHPYLAILPEELLPVFRLDKQTLKSLSVSSHISEILKMVRAISRQYAHFFARLLTTNLPISKNFTYDFYCWGVSIVSSRQNKVPSARLLTDQYPESINALIPILDMCNHDPKSTRAVFEIDIFDGSKLEADRNIEVGQEILINYGCRSSGDFFIHNGFVPAEVVPDLVPLSVSLNQDDPDCSSKAKLLNAFSLPVSGNFKLVRKNFENRNRRDPQLTMFLIVYLLTEAELKLFYQDGNPVIVADEVYEYVQQHTFLAQHQETCKVTNDNEGADKLSTLKKKLTISTMRYLSKRAAISVALLDRVLMDKSLDRHVRRLLEHEKSIFKSYVMPAET